MVNVWTKESAGYSKILESPRLQVQTWTVFKIFTVPTEKMYTFSKSATCKLNAIRVFFKWLSQFTRIASDALTFMVKMMIVWKFYCFSTNATIVTAVAADRQKTCILQITINSIQLIQMQWRVFTVHRLVKMLISCEIKTLSSWASLYHIQISKYVIISFESRITNMQKINDHVFVKLSVLMY